MAGGTTINPNDASFLRSLDLNQSGQVDAKEAKKAVGSVVHTGTGKAEHVKDGEAITPEKIDVFTAEAKDKGASQEVIDKVVNLAKGSPGASAIPVPPATAQTVQHLPQWMDLSSTKLDGIATGQGETTLSFFDKDSNAMYLNVYDRNSKPPTVAFHRHDLPYDSDKQAQLPVSPALAEKLADVMQGAIHNAQMDVGRDERIEREDPRDAMRRGERPKEKIVHQDPVQDVDGRMEDAGAALQTLNAYAGRSPSAMDKSAPSPDAFPEPAVPSRADRIRTEIKAQSSALQLIRRGGTNDLSDAERQAVRCIKAVDVGPDGNGYANLVVHYDATNAPIGQVELADLLHRCLGKQGIDVHVDAYVLGFDKKPAFNHGKLTGV